MAQEAGNEPRIRNATLGGPPTPPEEPCQQQSERTYAEYLTSLRDKWPEHRWLSDYMARMSHKDQRSKAFMMVVDACEDDLDIQNFKALKPADKKTVYETLETQPSNVRVIFVTQRQDDEILARDDSTFLDPGVLDILGRTLDVDPHFFESHLNTASHTSFSPRTAAAAAHSEDDTVEEWRFHLGTGFRNHASVLIRCSRPNDVEEPTWTVLILAATSPQVDAKMWDVLGPPGDIRPHFHAVGITESPSQYTPAREFEYRLRNLRKAGLRLAYREPMQFVVHYAHFMSAAFCCQIDVWRDFAAQNYGPGRTIANGKHRHDTEAMGGRDGKEERERIRQHWNQLCDSSVYLASTFRQLLRIQSQSKEASSTLSVLIDDYREFHDEVERLKRECETFLQHQIEKLALAEAKRSLDEARSLKRLSFIGFVFAPLNLATSFFGMNIRELNDTGLHLWAFAAAALTIASLAMLGWRISTEGLLVKTVEAFRFPSPSIRFPRERLKIAFKQICYSIAACWRGRKERGSQDLVEAADKSRFEGAKGAAKSPPSSISFHMPDYQSDTSTLRDDPVGI
ncbi:MAG: hypothetical protein M4579_002551 [Chaenotheca gracillima]|nr:MAG: hypothetical protein M4579_002551 [Chaenotheca gracillima]